MVKAVFKYKRPDSQSPDAAPRGAHPQGFESQVKKRASNSGKKLLFSVMLKVILTECRDKDMACGLIVSRSP